jgi:hypothetical protein
MDAALAKELTMKIAIRAAMRSGAVAFIFLAAIALLFAACSSPSLPVDGAAGSVSVSIGGNSRAGLTWEPSTDSSLLAHTVTLSGGSGGPHEKTIPAGGGTATFTSVATGEWTLTVEGRLGGVLKSRATKPITVKTGNNSFSITMGDPTDIPLTPVATDYTFGNLAQMAGSVIAVTITPDTGRSEGRRAGKEGGLTRRS